MRGQPCQLEVAVTTASDRLEQAQRHALAALDTLDAAKQALQEAVENVRRLVAGLTEALARLRLLHAFCLGTLLNRFLNGA